VIDTGESGGVVGKEPFAGDPFHTGPVYEVDRLFNVFPALFFLQAPAAFCIAACKVFLICNALISAAAPAFPVAVPHGFQGSKPAESLSCKVCRPGFEELFFPAAAALGVTAFQMAGIDFCQLSAAAPAPPLAVTTLHAQVFYCCQQSELVARFDFYGFLPFYSGSLPFMRMRKSCSAT
ncbi:MAG: hypothetical protein KBS39_03100, partial [Lachnospiraceae bacterium]|nr:hypothetical protein [Candidatus Hippenecus merdae]